MLTAAVLRYNGLSVVYVLLLLLLPLMPEYSSSGTRKPCFLFPLTKNWFWARKTTHNNKSKTARGLISTAVVDMSGDLKITSSLICL